MITIQDNIGDKLRRRIFSVSGLILLYLLISISVASASGVRTSPPYIFYSYNSKSEHISIVNPSDNTIEVWLEFKYGYPMIDDTGKVSVVLRNSLQPDDPSAAGWIRAYPDRFTLGPQEVQVVRMVVNPPPGIKAGEYWARILVSSKDQQKPLVRGKPGLGGAFQLISINSVAFHYRHQSTATGVRLSRPVETSMKEKNLIITLPLQRTGNASFWGKVFCKIISSAGRQVFTQSYNLVVYKDMPYFIKIDNSTLTPGDYTIELTARTERTDIRSSYLLKSDPVTWTVPLKIP